MRRLNPTKLHVRFINPANETGPITPRCYTLTHSDRTGELFLTIGPEYNQKQIRGWYTRFMRDEVLAEWVSNPDGYELHVHCEIERGFGSVSFREGIFRRELGLVLEAFRYGDRQLVEVAPILDSSHIKIRFQLRNSKDDYIEDWGPLSDYR